MRWRSGSKYAFGNRHTSNCQLVIHLRSRNSAHDLHNELIYPPSLHLFFSSWNCQAQNERQNKWTLLSYLTHFQVHILMIQVQWSVQLMHVTCACSFDSGWDTLLATNACSYMEKHLSTAVMSASSILLAYLSFYPNPTSHPSSKLICLKHVMKWQLTAQLYFVVAAIEDSSWQTYHKQTMKWH